MWNDDELVMISALQHWSYCPRQCGLIHVEQVFDENLFTMRGRIAHERADEPESVETHGRRIERALPIWSDRLGLQGKADVVEFHDDGRIVPVEYKHGPRRSHRHDDLQVCAQALCLEEMFRCAIAAGAVYHHSSRHRREVEITLELRQDAEETIRAVRQMRRLGVLPPPADDARCPNCSLIDACSPSVVARLAGRSARAIFRLSDSEGLA